MWAFRSAARECCHRVTSSLSWSSIEHLKANEYVEVGDFSPTHDNDRGMS